MTAREAAEKLFQAKGLADEVLRAWPDEADGSGILEHAISELGCCEDELDRVADEHGERA